MRPMAAAGKVAVLAWASARSCSGDSSSCSFGGTGLPRVSRLRVPVAGRVLPPLSCSWLAAVMVCLLLVLWLLGSEDACEGAEVGVGAAQAGGAERAAGYVPVLPGGGELGCGTVPAGGAG